MNCLRHARILDLSIETLSLRRQLGTVAQITEGPAIIARYRELSASVAFHYRGTLIVEFSSWISLQAAVSDARHIATTRGLGPDEPGEIAINVRITERSTQLAEPDQHAVSLYGLHSRDIDRAIEAIAGHQRVESEYLKVWSSLSTDAANHKRVAEVQDTFCASSLSANTFLLEARKRFAAIRRGVAA